MMEPTDNSVLEPSETPAEATTAVTSATEPSPAKKNSTFNIPAFWHVQQSDWKVTVVRTSLERLGYQMIYPYLSIYIIALGAQKTQLGVITSIGMILAGLLGPYTGQLIDRKGPKKIYLAGISMLIVAYLAYATATVWQAAAAGMIIYYLGQGTGGHSCATICGNCLANCDRAKGMLVCESLAAGLLGMVGPLLSGWVLVYFMGVKGTPTNAGDIRPLFYIALGITIISLFVVALKLSNSKGVVSGEIKRGGTIKEGLEIIKRYKHTGKWLIIGTISGLPMGMVLPYTQLFAAEQKHASAATLAIMVTAAALTSVVCGYPIGALSDKIGRKKVLFITIPLFLLSNVMLLVANSPAMLIFAGILQGFFNIGTTLSATIAREIVPSNVMGRWLGINRLISSLFSALMAAVSGMIYDGLGAQYVFIIYIAVDLLIRIPLLIKMPETLHYTIEETSPAQG